MRRGTKYICLAITCLFIIASIAKAELKLRVIDTAKQVLQAEYRVDIKVSTWEKKRYFTFPDDGFSFADDSIKVVSVTNLNTGEDLRWSLVPAKNDPNLKMLQVSYQVQFSQGEVTKKFPVLLVVEAQTKNITTRQDGTLNISYYTGHDITLVIPEGKCLVETNERVKIDSDEEGIIATAKGGQARKVEYSVK